MVKWKSTSLLEQLKNQSSREKLFGAKAFKMFFFS